MELAARTGAWSGKTLPYDAEVEWLEGVYGYMATIIDTGLIPTNKDGIDFQFSKFEFLSTDINFIGVKQSTDRFMVNISGEISTSHFGSGFCRYYATQIPHEYNSSHIYNVRQNFENNGLFIVDEFNPIQLNAQKINITRSFYLFSQNRDDREIESYKYRLHSFKYSRGSDCILNLKPVRINNVGLFFNDSGTGGINPDGTPRNDGLYFNIGTGAFVIGPDKTT